MSVCVVLDLFIKDVASMNQAAALVPALRELLSRKGIENEGNIEPQDDGTVAISVESSLLCIRGFSEWTSEVDQAVKQLVSEHSPGASAHLYWMDPEDGLGETKD
ncbi:hypothetical protein ACIRRA_42605 [Nocardia sp. NPDC101769]|uniref:hypothetical protein n=1 Tax=Nocardia sp. NPDC101769 TaxID=3364333 RepID=UPI00380C473D